MLRMVRLLLLGISIGECTSQCIVPPLLVCCLFSVGVHYSGLIMVCSKSSGFLYGYPPVFECYASADH